MADAYLDRITLTLDAVVAKFGRAMKLLLI